MKRAYGANQLKGRELLKVSDQLDPTGFYSYLRLSILTPFPPPAQFSISILSFSKTYKDQNAWISWMCKMLFIITYQIS